MHGARAHVLYSSRVYFFFFPLVTVFELLSLYTVSTKGAFINLDEINGEMRQKIADGRLSCHSEKNLRTIICTLYFFFLAVSLLFSLSPFCPAFSSKESPVRSAYLLQLRSGRANFVVATHVSTEYRFKTRALYRVAERGLCDKG